jgi:ATP-dependent Lhr-like helicase
MLLDRLCLAGLIGWGRVSLHPATHEENLLREDDDKKRVIPTSIAPITFFIRD